ncbi:MAG: tetratricopeptide repeat protein [Gammaproteobacteria bacterium]|nr:tetratricopeptide repeat protein [Gammaproteobacteria bacterium]
MDQQPTSGCLQIGDLVLDIGKRQVRRGKAVLDLPRLSYQLVLVLARAAPNLVTHDELVKLVWSGKFVSPETVTQRIKLVRRALGDNADSPRYIGLVRGEGYRMLAEVRELSEPDDGIAQHLFAELGRRRVLQTALIYAAAAWSITEVLSFLIEALPVFPEGSKSFVAILFVVGFPVTMFLAWRFDIGPGGVRRAQTSSAEGRLTIVAATALLIGATAGLFYLVYPSVVGLEESGTAQRENRERPAKNTIAVMPFENASQYVDDDYIPKGLSDELRDQLGRIGGMRVAARSSSVIFQNQTLSAPEIAMRLGVAQLIEGTVRRQDNVLHITVTVIDGESGFGDWTKTFRKRDDDLLTAQQEIATEIVALLMPGSDPSLGRSTLATLDASANELLQLARITFQEVKDQPTVKMEQLSKAIELYRRATEADPNSALAHSRYADALLYLGDIESAGAAIVKALEINPNLSEVQNTLALYRWMRFENAGDAHARAIELNPFNADALAAYAKWLWHQPDTDEAEIYFLRALDQDPESLLRYAELGNFYGVSGQRDKALEIAADIQERFSNSPKKAVAFLHLARIHELVGNLDVGIAWAMRSRAADPDYADAPWMLAELYARIGDEEGARHFDPDTSFINLYWFRRYQEMIEVGSDLALENPNQVQIWYGLARAHLALGDYEQAIYILDRQGLPERVFVDTRRANGIETLMIYADALNANGQFEKAHEFAEFVNGIMSRLRQTGSQNAWWPIMYEACGYSILGEDKLALETLERVMDSPGLLWYPVLVDSPCFRKFKDEKRYKAVVNSVELRQKVLRDRLPETLQRFKVAP